jgi:hypothetical protein
LTKTQKTETEKTMCIPIKHKTPEEIAREHLHEKMLRFQESIMNLENRWRDVMDSKDRRPVTFEQLDEE